MTYKLVTEMTLEQMGIINQQLMDDIDNYGIDEKKVLDSARLAINTWTSYFQDNITAGKRDMKFLLRDQWESNERAQFIQLQKVCLTINTMADTVNKIIAEQRKMRPALMVRSINGIASDEDLQLRTDLLRSISYHSDNDIVYQTAFSSAMQFGYGAFAIYIDYETPNSFRKVIRYDLVEDPTTIFFDPAAKEPHKGDGNYCGRLIMMSLDEFTSTYPYIPNPLSYQQPQMLNTRLFKMKDIVVICEFFQKEWYPKTIHELTDGRIVDQEELDEIEREHNEIEKRIKISAEKNEEPEAADIIMLRQKPQVKATRHTQDYRIMHYRLLRDRIIEVTEWPSKELPIVFVPGRTNYLEGKQYTKSFICDARDIQKFANYLVSDIATEVKNRRREQWIGTPDNITGQELEWRLPEVQQGILLANVDPKTGQLPQRLPPSEVPQSILATLNYAVSGIQQVLGYFDANLGKQSNENSGVAIENRATQGNLSAFVFFDNMNQAIAQGGKVVLSLMPVIYGEERSVVLSNAAGESRTLILNKKNKDGTVENPILHGDYDIEISAAPSFAVQKAQSLELFMKLAMSNPEILPLVADLIAKNLDVEDQNRIVKRFEKLVPPAILAEERGEEPPPPKPSPQEQMMQMQQQIAQQQMQEKAQEIKVKEERLQLEKAKLAMEAMELQEKLKSHQHEREYGMHKADLDFTAKIASIVKDLHK